jgi:hypothetical protein
MVHEEDGKQVKVWRNNYWAKKEHRSFITNKVVPSLPPFCHSAG